MARYQRRISGPLLDRIDLFIDVARVDYEKLMSGQQSEPSSAVAARVAATRRVQRERADGGVLLNSDLGPSQVREHAQAMLTGEARKLLSIAVQRLGLSARAYHRVLKVSRTIADLGGSLAIEQAHVAEALQYRAREE